MLTTLAHLLHDNTLVLFLTLLFIGFMGVLPLIFLDSRAPRPLLLLLSMSITLLGCKFVVDVSSLVP